MEKCLIGRKKMSKKNDKEKDEMMLEISVIRGDISQAKNHISKAEESCYELLRKLNKESQ